MLIDFSLRENGDLLQRSFKPVLRSTACSEHNESARSMLGAQGALLGECSEHEGHKKHCSELYIR